MEYKVCKSCVMDTSDPNISFNSEGICSHCQQYFKYTKPFYEKNLKNSNFIEKEISNGISNRDQKYDSILGISGGMDSSYMLHHIVRNLKLRPLVFHVDTGWNSIVSSTNIEKITKALNVDLYTVVINWEEMRKLQLAFFKSGVPHLDTPQDQAFLATLYDYALKFKIKNILNGGNIVSEGVKHPLKYLYWSTDSKHNKDIRKKFGAEKLRTFPFSSVLRHKIWLRYFKGVKVYRPLNYIPFNKVEVIEELQNLYGWTPYKEKHYESRFTRFYEGYWLRYRFNFDTRRTTYSSLILNQQMSRQDALERLSDYALSREEIEAELNYVANKLQITYEELIKYRDMPVKYYWDYKNSRRIFDLGAYALRFFGKEEAIAK